MTKKQIETLILNIQICQTEQAVIEKCKEIRNFLREAWELWFWNGSYEKMTATEKQIWQAGSARIAELRGLQPNA